MLAVPKLNFDIDHRFSEFAGAKGSFGVLREARQRTRFRLDETGARLRSVGSLHATLGIDQPVSVGIDEGDFTGNRGQRCAVGVA